jgi:hypothetical protein
MVNDWYVYVIMGHDASSSSLAMVYSHDTSKRFNPMVWDPNARLYTSSWCGGDGADDDDDDDSEGNVMRTVASRGKAFSVVKASLQTIPWSEDEANDVVFSFGLNRRLVLRRLVATWVT